MIVICGESCRFIPWPALAPRAVEERVASRQLGLVSAGVRFPLCRRGQRTLEGSFVRWDLTRFSSSQKVWSGGGRLSRTSRGRRAPVSRAPRSAQAAGPASLAVASASPGPSLRSAHLTCIPDPETCGRDLCDEGVLSASPHVSREVRTAGGVRVAGRVPIADTHSHAVGPPT